MAGTKNVKISEVVYDKIEAEMKGGETFDDTLRRMVGLYPDVERLMAYLPKERRDWGEEFVELVDDLGNFEWEVVKNHRGSRDSVVFKDKEEEIEIASVDVSEEDFDVHYRDKNGDMTIAVCGADIQSEDDCENASDEVKSKVSGAVRKWGSTQDCEVG